MIFSDGGNEFKYAFPTLNGRKVPKNTKFTYKDGVADITFIIVDKSDVDFLFELGDEVELSVTWGDDRYFGFGGELFTWKITDISSAVDEFTEVSLRLTRRD